MDQNIQRMGSEQSDADNDLISRAPGEPERTLPDSEWDAGEMGCGELVFQLRLRLNPMRPGQLLKLTACDPAVPEDLPAWCRLVGHALMEDFKFLREHTRKPVKVTLPGPYLLSRSTWVKNLSDAAYPTREALVDDAAELLRAAT